MKTQSQKEALVNSLLPLLNELQNTNESNKPIIVAELKEPITFADLMALSDAELEGLQKLVNSTRSAKKAQKQTNMYDSLMQPKYVIIDAPEKPKTKIF